MFYDIIPESKNLVKIRLGDQLHEFMSSHEGRWRNDETNHKVGVVAPAGSDLLIDPADGKDGVSVNDIATAPTLLTQQPGHDFQFSAKVKVNFTKHFDGGVLLVWHSQTHWAKLCFEYAPGRGPFVISVVNNGGRSDDAYSMAVSQEEMHLRVSKVDSTYYLHASFDGIDWLFVRMFKLACDQATPLIGFLAQAPASDGCSVSFESFSLVKTTLSDHHNRR